MRLLVGTTKGAFLLDPAAHGWTMSGPHCDGRGINHMIGDNATGRIWATWGNAFSGAGIWRSEDAGETWDQAQLANGQIEEMLACDAEMAAYIGRGPNPPAPFDGEIEAFWSLCHIGDTLYAGAKPAMLYRSYDGGVTWERVEGLAQHPSRDSWSPGGAGLTLHTILSDPLDPARLWLGISAAGVFTTEDSGERWERRNALAGGNGADIGHCVHNMVRTTGAQPRIYMQNHEGTFRTEDDGKTWHDISDGLPSRFGFPIGVHPDDPKVIWTIPMNGDMAGRYPPDAQAAVWKSTDGGDTWRACRTGLPQENCYFTVLRQALAVAADAKDGIFFGTNTGALFHSKDDGESWEEIARHLPTVLSVEVME